MIMANIEMKVSGWGGGKEERRRPKLRILFELIMRVRQVFMLLESVTSFIVLLDLKVVALVERRLMVRESRL